MRRLYSGSQTISAAMGLSTDAINRLGLPPEQAKALYRLDAGRIRGVQHVRNDGSAIIIAIVGPKLLGDRSRRRMQGLRGEIRWRAVRGRRRGRLGLAALDDACVQGAARRQGGGPAGFRGRGTSCPARECSSSACAPQRPDHRGDRRHGPAGRRHRGHRGPARSARKPDRRRRRPRSRTRSCWPSPSRGIDVLVTNKAVDGKTLAGARRRPRCARRVPAQDYAGRHRNRYSNPREHQGRARRPVHVGWPHAGTPRRQPSCLASQTVRPISRTWPSSGAAIVVGALIGALVFKVAGVPLTLSTAGGALIGRDHRRLVCARCRPKVRRIPTPTVWVFMNSVGLNIFIAIVGISAGPGFVNGLKTQGIGLFLWGALATTDPAGARDVRGQVHVQVPRRIDARHRVRRADHHGIRSGWCATPPRARSRRWATPSRMPSATRC